MHSLYAHLAAAGITALAAVLAFALSTILERMTSRR